MIGKRLYVVDTGYLTELYQVGDRCDPQAGREVKRRFVEAVERGDEFYVPVPVLFELGNHIANMKTGGGQRREKAERFRADVKSSCEQREPWVVTAFASESSVQAFSEVLVSYCTEFAQEFAPARVGLTDVAVVHEAKRLKAKFAGNGQKTYAVHIWTRDAKVKAWEPDREVSPFV